MNTIIAYQKRRALVVFTVYKPWYYFKVIHAVSKQFIYISNNGIY